MIHCNFCSKTHNQCHNLPEKISPRNDSRHIILIPWYVTCFYQTASKGYTVTYSALDGWSSRLRWSMKSSRSSRRIFNTNSLQCQSDLLFWIINSLNFRTFIVATNISTFFLINYAWLCKLFIIIKYILLYFNSYCYDCGVWSLTGYYGSKFGSAKGLILLTFLATTGLKCLQLTWDIKDLHKNVLFWC